MKCAVCREREATREYHINYYPEIKIEVCELCHAYLHQYSEIKRMKPYILILETLWRRDDNFISREQLKQFCSKYNVEYDNVVRYLLTHGWIIRIFRGIFYIKSLEEKNLGTLNYNIWEMVAEGIRRKGVSNWYYGLHTALNFHNITNEYYPVIYVINTEIFRRNPIMINGHPFKFYRLKDTLFNFGICEEDGLRYSDPEKTILDFIYIWRYNSVPEERIKLDVSEWVDSVSLNKLREYSIYYPKTVRKFVMRF